MKFLIFIFLFSVQSFASNFVKDNIKKLDWNGIEVIWLKNEKLPMYQMSVYFADGASGDPKKEAGLTDLMLDQLSSGTLQYNQKQIADIFEFYGTGISSRVTHEYSTVSIGGMMKDAIPTVKMMCHLFANSTYPVKKLKSYKLRLITGLKNLVNNKGALADRVFRELSLNGSQYSRPVGGTIKSINHIKVNDLVNRLEFFNKKVFKRIYVSGPRDIKELESVITKDCKWSGQAKYVRAQQKRKKNKISKKPIIYFLPVKKANQAQIRIGRIIRPKKNKNEREYVSFSASFMGGGFTSKLMQELRVKRGLTYGVSSFAAYQRDYGRAVISTFTKNQSIAEALSVIQDVIGELSQGKFTEKEVALKKKFASGQFLFSFENSSSILNQLMHYDHVGEDYSTLHDYPQIINKLSSKRLAQELKETFNWKEQVIVVVGSPKIERDLYKVGRVKTIKLKDYL